VSLKSPEKVLQGAWKSGKWGNARDRSKTGVWISEKGSPRLRLGHGVSGYNNSQAAGRRGCGAVRWKWKRSNPDPVAQRPKARRACCPENEKTASAKAEARRVKLRMKAGQFIRTAATLRNNTQRQPPG
jgi:hypothetical protein